MKTIPLTTKPCQRCLDMARNGVLRFEMVQRLPKSPYAPSAVDGSGPCCRDCGAADTLTRVSKGLNFEMARVAVGNDRQEQYRLPGVPLGLVQLGLMAPSIKGDLEEHRLWLDANNWFERGPDAEDES